MTTTTLQIININNHDLAPKEVNGQRVVTFRDVDELHDRPNGTAGRNFRENREYFIEGEDFFKICPDEIRRNNIMDVSPKAHQDIVFLTEFGYLMLVKSLTDKLAWQVQRQLVNGYFRAKSSTTPTLQSTNPLLEQSIMSLQQSQQNLINCVMEQGYQLADHEKQLEAINESIANLEKSLEHDFIYADRWDEVQNEFYHLNRIIDEMRIELQGRTATREQGNINVGQMDLIRSIIKPLGEKLHDRSLGYKATYRKVYKVMDVGWKYRATKYQNQHQLKTPPKKIVLVQQDKKLLAVFEQAVVKMLQEI